MEDEEEREFCASCFIIFYLEFVMYMHLKLITGLLHTLSTIFIDCCSQKAIIILGKVVSQVQKYGVDNCYSKILVFVNLHI